MANTDIVRTGLVGCGAFSKIIAAEINKSKNTQLVTCYDPVVESRITCSETFGCEHEDSFENMVKRNDIDAVFILSPNMYHAEQAELAARNGKHVFVEKPIANTIADGKKNNRRM